MRGDLDTYRIQVPAGTWLNADLLRADNAWRLDLGPELAADVITGEMSGGAVRAGVWIEEPQGVQVTVSLPGADEATGYDLVLSFCSPDASEPDNGPETAAPTGPFSNFDRTLCSPADEDWHRLDALASDILVVARAWFPEQEGDIDLYLFGPDLELLAVGGNEGPLESIVHVTHAPGTHFLRVVLAPEREISGLNYDLDLGLEAVPSECEADVFEPNDSPATGRMLMSTIYEDLTACPEDEDHFVLPLGAGDEVELQLDFFDDEGDLDLLVFDPAGGLIASAESQSDDEALAFVAEQDGLHRVEVVLAADRGGMPGNRYGIAVEGGGSVCAPDPFEPNDTPEAAPPVPSGDYRDQTVCPSDDDWYLLELGFGEEVIINIGYDPGEGDVDGFLYAPDGALAAEGTTGGNETFAYDVAESGLYLLHIVLAEEAGAVPGTVYDFGVLSIPTSNCSPDAYEPNESQGSAFPLGVGLYPGATACTGEVDWYRVDLPPEGGTAIITRSAGDGFVTAGTYDATGELVGKTALADEEDALLELGGGTQWLAIEAEAVELVYGVELIY